MKDLSNFLELSYTNRVWAIGSIHSHYNSFESIKTYILEKFSNRDKLVFLGNIIGYGDMSKETLDSVLDLRNKLMSKFFLQPEDIVFLRGAQEEMFLKLLQLQTAPNPFEIVKWMFDHGVDKTIHSYGLDSSDLLKISNQGTLSINKWTSKINFSVSQNPGHKEYFSNLHHAAFTTSKKILFVNRGVDIKRPLSAQNDCFWWGYHNFSKLNQPYGTFVKIVRGYEPKLFENFENIKNKIVCSLYKGPLSNKKITAGLFNDSGDILDIFESK